MRFLGRSLMALFLTALTVGLLVIAGNTTWSALQDRWSQEGRDRPARERVFAVNVVDATPQEITPVLRAFGEIQSTRALELRVPRGGTVVHLAPGFAEGGRVEEGQLLLRLDPSEAEAALATAEADLREAEADSRDAARLALLAEEDVTAARGQSALRLNALERQRDLLERGVGSAASVETAELAYASAEQTVLSRRQALANATARVEQTAAGVTRRQIAVREAERRLGETELYAEFDGTLSNVAVTLGGLISANEQIARVIDPSDLEVAIRLSTPQHGRLLDSDGQLRKVPVTVVMDVLGLEQSIEGQLTREASAVGEGQTGRQVFADLDAAGGFRPGDFVEVQIAEPALRFAVRLPATALNAQSAVLVINAENRLEELPVTLLRRQGDDVLVRARDLADRQVVAVRTPLLGAGIRVEQIRQPTDDTAAAAPTTMRLDPERKARLIAFVEGNNRMPSDVRKRILNRLNQEEVPINMVERIESRMGG